MHIILPEPGLLCKMLCPKFEKYFRKLILPKSVFSAGDTEMKGLCPVLRQEGKGRKTKSTGARNDSVAFKSLTSTIKHVSPQHTEYLFVEENHSRKAEGKKKRERERMNSTILQ